MKGKKHEEFPKLGKMTFYLAFANNQRSSETA